MISPVRAKLVQSERRVSSKTSRDFGTWKWVTRCRACANGGTRSSPAVAPCSAAGTDGETRRSPMQRSCGSSCPEQKSHSRSHIASQSARPRSKRKSQELAFRSGVSSVRSETLRLSNGFRPTAQDWGTTGPYSRGASHQRNPLRLMKSMPDRKRRSSLRRLPWDLGKKVSRRAIRASVSQKRMLISPVITRTVTQNFRARSILTGPDPGRSEAREPARRPIGAQKILDNTDWPQILLNRNS